MSKHKVIDADGNEINVEELLEKAGEPKPVKKDPLSIDWLSLSNKLSFKEYHEMRQKYGLE
jgi:hypothetical protein